MSNLERLVAGIATVSGALFLAGKIVYVDINCIGYCPHVGRANNPSTYPPKFGEDGSKCTPFNRNHVPGCE
jgi:hypothetical protein